SEGLGGAIGKRGVNTRDGVVQYVEVESIDDALRNTPQLGGRVLTPKSEVQGQGWYAIVADSEGNEIGLWETTAATS
ncbi:MAG: VOC family protein, partial [Chloroflexota bacterium]|nr:VOC family protein [Chloroflexota bacterium]